VYRAGSGDALRLTQLTNERVYYVIKVDDNTLQLAETLDDAFNRTALAIASTEATAQHSLTRVFAFSNAGTLAGDRETDTFALGTGARLSGSIDGRAGFNAIVGPSRDATWTAFDRALNRSDRVALDTLTSAITAIAGGDTLTVDANAWHTVKPWCTGAATRPSRSQTSSTTRPIS